MPPDGAPAGIAVHASAVAIGRRALLIRGPSHSGKSRLALALVAASTRARPIRLIGDDRILLCPEPHGLVARPHPRIAGFVERRGLGLVAVPWVARARIAACVVLGAANATTTPPGLENFPALSLVDVDEADRAYHVLDWWCLSDAAHEQHPGSKAAEAGRLGAKD